MRVGSTLIILALTATLTACISLPKSRKQNRIADACAVAALAVGDIIKTHKGDTAAETRSSVILGVSAEYRLTGSVEQALDLRQCPGVATLALGGGMTLWALRSPPPGGLHFLSSPEFDASGTHARVTWALSDARLHGISYGMVRTPTGWTFDGEAAEWSIIN